MNKRTFAVSLLLSALPSLAMAGSINLNKGDFRSAKRFTRNGEVLLSLKLSKSGKAKFRELKKERGGPVRSNVAGVTNDFTLRAPITGNQLEAGPYSEEDAQAVLTAINGE